MPRYDYKCPDCGNVFEQQHSIKFEGDIECPKCGYGKCEKQISKGVGVRFIGDGFYVNDYKNKGES